MITLIVLGIILLLVLVIWSIKRHRDPKLRVECDAPVDQLIPSLAGLSLGTCVDGNSVEILRMARTSTFCCRTLPRPATQCTSRRSFGRKACWESASPRPFANVRGPA